MLFDFALERTFHLTHIQEQLDPCLNINANLNIDKRLDVFKYTNIASHNLVSYIYVMFNMCLYIYIVTLITLGRQQ